MYMETTQDSYSRTMLTSSAIYEKWRVCFVRWHDNNQQVFACAEAQTQLLRFGFN